MPRWAYAAVATALAAVLGVGVLLAGVSIGHRYTTVRAAIVDKTRTVTRTHTRTETRTETATVTSTPVIVTHPVVVNHPVTGTVTRPASPPVTVTVTETDTVPGLSQ